MTIFVTTGQKFREIGECHKVSIQIQELELQTDLFSLPLKKMDIVLGAKWLIQLGSYTTNLEEQFPECNWQGRHYKLYGVNSTNFKEGTN